MLNPSNPVGLPIGNDVRDGSEPPGGPNRICPVCQVTFHTSGRGRYCSGTCRQRAFRARRAAATMDVPRVTRALKRQGEMVAYTVYECPQCEARFLGHRRCPDCNLMCRRVGLGGACPHCDEPVAVSDLLP